MNEVTISHSVPGAHVEVAFSKLGLDARKFLKGEQGVYAVEYPLNVKTLPSALEHLYRVQSTGSDLARTIADALIVNLTTQNSITDNELSFMYSIAKQGGTAQLVPAIESNTPGMGKALGKIKYRGTCSSCGFRIPVYTGRYPKLCPQCGSPLQVKEGVDELGITLRYMCERRHAAVDLALHESATVTLVPPPKEIENPSPVQAALLSTFPYHWEGEMEIHEMATNGEVFEGLVDYLIESGNDRACDGEISGLFEKFPLCEKPNLTTSLRQEVLKRPPLMRSIVTLDEKQGDKRFFTLGKALSSCYTRAMIEGEARGGEAYKQIAYRLFEMMQLAFNDELDGPARFLKCFFIGG